MSRKINIPKKELKRLYEKKKLSTYQIAEIYCCDPTVIQNRLREHSIHIRHPKKKIVIPKKTLEKLYVKERLSSYKIAKLYNCTSSTIYYKLKECDIKTRSLKIVVISKNKLKKLYVNQGFSIPQIAKIYNCSDSTVLKNMRKYGIKSRETSEANTKYPKKDFSGNFQKKAYMIGFRLGDLNVRVGDSIISIRTNTTKPEQVELIEKIFGHYGRFYVKNLDNIFYVQCFLNKTFSFLIPKEDKIEDWILNNTQHFVAFLSGYTDAEGNIGVYDGRARFRLGSYDKNILHQIFIKLNSLGVRTKLILESPRGRYNQNKDFWRLSVNHKYSLLKLFDLIDPHLKHLKRIKDMEKAKENIRIRNERFDVGK